MNHDDEIGDEQSEQAEHLQPEEDDDFSEEE